MGLLEGTKHDSLTGLYNYRYFHDTLARSVANAHRDSRRLALVVFDIDAFKTVNDRVGHLAGDNVLAGLAQLVRSVGHGADIACRVGGDEFAVILPESTRADAEALHRRLQTAVKGLGAGDAPLGICAGIAELQADDDVVSFFRRADEALYRAKQGGQEPPPLSGVREPRRPKPSGGRTCVSKRLGDDHDAA